MKLEPLCWLTMTASLPPPPALVTVRVAVAVCHGRLPGGCARQRRRDEVPPSPSLTRARAHPNRSGSLARHNDVVTRAGKPLGHAVGADVQHLRPGQNLPSMKRLAAVWL